MAAQHRTVRLPRAAALGDTPRWKRVTVEIGPDAPSERHTDLRKTRARFDAQAEELPDALYGCAPGGLIDAIFWQMARRQASVLHVSHGR